MSGWGRGGSQFRGNSNAPSGTSQRGRGRGRGHNSNTTPSQAITVPFASPHPIIDIGANLQSSRFKKSDMTDVLARSHQANVTRIIITGTDLPNSQVGLNMCQNNTSQVQLYCTIGVHPHDAKSCNSDTIEAMKKLVTSGGKNVVSIGETGLDFNRNYSPQDVQIEWFDRQVALACELSLPLFLHERESHTAFMKVMQKHFVNGSLPVPAVVHCFTGTQQEAEVYIKNGFYIGFTGVICQYERGKPLRDIISSVVPLDKILIETDAPFMLPTNKLRDQYNGRNEPCLLPYVIKTIAECKGVKEEIVAQTVTQNTLKFFKIE
jgi:TatD DNase family protein